MKFSRLRVTAVLAVVCCFHLFLHAQSTSTTEIPIERCDRLPTVKVRIGSTEMRFLVDTGATTILNLKSFAGGKSKQIEIDSWKGKAATSAREVTVASFTLGDHTIRDLKLPAIDLSPIGLACGGPIDGLLGVDLLDRMGVTIDLRRQVASLGAVNSDPKAVYDEMEAAMLPCDTAFDKGDAKTLEQCFDPEIVLYTPFGEYKGRNQVMEYLKQRYFKYAPNLHFAMSVREVQVFGNALWYSYDYSVRSPKDNIEGRGMSMCRKSDGRWRILNMHNSLRDIDPGAVQTRESK
jgi:ketosteroid isomerase-like protein